MNIFTSNIVVPVVIIFILILVDADIRKDCRNETGVSWNSLKKIKAGNFITTDRKLKCYLKCFMQKNGIFNENDIDVEKTLRHLPTSYHARSKIALERCKKNSAKESCDKAFQISKCFFKAQPELLQKIPLV